MVDHGEESTQELFRFLNLLDEEDELDDDE
jgi:hypothetical protein